MLKRKARLEDSICNHNQISVSLLIGCKLFYILLSIDKLLLDNSTSQDMLDEDRCGGLKDGPINKLNE